MTPKTSFITSDLWQWLEVHMWVVVTFEIFTIVIVSYRYREVGIVSTAKAKRSAHILVVLFCLTAVIGVGHNFYCLATPTGVIALGSVFSTARVFLLILLTLVAWRHTRTEELAEEGTSWEKSDSSSWEPISGTCSVPASRAR